MKIKQADIHFAAFFVALICLFLRESINTDALFSEKQECRCGNPTTPLTPPAPLTLLARGCWEVVVGFKGSSCVEMTRFDRRCKNKNRLVSFKTANPNIKRWQVRKCIFFRMENYACELYLKSSDETTYIENQPILQFNAGFRAIHRHKKADFFFFFEGGNQIWLINWFFFFYPIPTNAAKSELTIGFV